MRGSSTFEKILIALLTVLLIGAAAAFVYLLIRYRSPSSTIFNSPSQTPENMLSAVLTDSPATDILPYITKTRIAEPLSTIDASTTQASPIPLASATQYMMNTPTLKPGEIPSHFIFRRPFDPNEPIWPLPALRFGSGANLSSRNSIHTGLDLLADYGTSVHALGSGTVIWEGYGIESNLGPDNAYGVAVTIRHDDMVYGYAVYSIYAHLSVTHVIKGDIVEEGDVVGEVGLTGNTSGPHLHLEVRLGDDDSFVTRNPELFIRPLAGSGVLVARLLNTDGSILYNQNVSVESLNNSQIWQAISYASGAATPDAVFKENLVIGDLPAGQYIITIEYGGASLLHSVIIKPGEISYFTFRGVAGFQDGLPEN